MVARGVVSVVNGTRTFDVGLEPERARVEIPDPHALRVPRVRRYQAPVRREGGPRDPRLPASKHDGIRVRQFQHDQLNAIENHGQVSLVG